MSDPSLLPSLKAKEIITDLRIRTASEIDIEDIAMERGVVVRERVLRGSEARLVRKGRFGIITVNTLIPEEGRKRFAVAHDLGHFELHRESQLLFCTEQDMVVWNENKMQEIEANEFAANMLMPESLFNGRLGKDAPNLDIVKELAGEFKTTLTATAVRCAQISTEPCAAVISRDGVIKWYKKSGTFKYHVKVGNKLSPNCYAFDYYDGVDLPAKPKKVPAYAWLAGNVDGEAEIIEHSQAFTRYDVVLSLLWIYEDIRPAWQMEDDDTELDLTSPFTPDGKRWQW
jgi:Zn-dependent peptidase ImmA (M78 family)